MSDKQGVGGDEVNFGFKKIDKSMGEKRSHQVAGVILLVAIILFSVLYKLGYIGIIKFFG